MLSRRAVTVMRLTSALNVLDERGHEVVGHGPRQLGALQLDENGGGLGVTDPDRQELVAVDRLEQHDGLLADDVEAHTVDDHFVHFVHAVSIRRHGRFLTSVPAACAGGRADGGEPRCAVPGDGAAGSS